MDQVYPLKRPSIWHVIKVFMRRYDFEIYLLRRNPVTLLGLGIIVLVTLIAIFAPILAPYDPLALTSADRLMGPSAVHWMGTDDYGRDILSRVIYATRLDMVIATSAVSMAMFIGVILGAVAGFFGGIIGEVIMRILDVIQAFPAFILAMALAVSLGSGKMTIIYVVAFIMVPIFARLMRSEILSARGRGYIEAAHCMGASEMEIIFKQLIPNCITPILVQFALSMSYAILDAAALSFIGLGIRPPEAEWGSMVNAGVGYITSGQLWLSVFPGLVMAIAILGFNLLADGMRDVLDPKLRS
ncbi:MAG TPA: peptide ABC transporter permease [Anaerolineae bacterium]|nr:peptide ABC transporter permease [Anaerolineae bacterium]HCC78745.1 peptide ABC transporter permease [Anaerolineae bacterium]HCM96536.1 peptide ABC transporter permease [Anaerolineae bacterium]